MRARTPVVIALLLIGLAAGVLSAHEGYAGGAIYVVDTTLDDQAIALTACTAAAGDCSLRGAIHNSNTNAGADTILFTAANSQIFNFQSTVQLEDIKESVTIDGTTEPAEGLNCINLAVYPCVLLFSNNPATTDGLVISNSAQNVTIKGVTFQNFVAGIRVMNGGGDVITGNYFGTGDGNTIISPNTYGIVVESAASDVTIGGQTGGERNVISGNSEAGILTSGSGTVIKGNYIGTNAAGTAALPNFRGIRVNGPAANTQIGGTSTSDRNVISGNAWGVFLSLVTSGSVLGNYIGTSADGTNALANSPFGVVVIGSSGVTIGGPTAGARNVISGNGFGISFRGQANNELVEGNYIGTNAAGTDAVGNVEQGIDFLTDGAPDNEENNTITGNVISGNGGGIRFHADPGTHANGNTITGNRIGLNATGTQAIPNDGPGILFNTSFGGGSQAQNNTIGGHDPGDGNVISGNTGAGIEFTGGGMSHNVIAGNVIGANAAATQPRGNIGAGIYIHDGANGATMEDNTIDSNGYGVYISTSGPGGNWLHNNYVGTNANGADGLGNDNAGIVFEAAQDNIVGNGPTPVSEGDAHPEALTQYANVIKNNGGAGVLLTSGSTGNRVLGNSIDDNGGLGIDIDGTSNPQEAPVLTAANSGSTHITGTLTSTPNLAFSIEFFASPVCDPSGFGEGRDFLGTVMVTADGTGLAVIDETLSPTTPGGQVITATATSGFEHTSEFSNCVTVVGPTPLPTPSPSPTPSPTPISHPTPTSTGAVMRGDGDCDGDVDLDDVIAALSEFAGVDPGAPCADQADVDCDSDVDAMDALRIAAFFAGVPMTPPSGCGQVGDSA